MGGRVLPILCMPREDVCIVLSVDTPVNHIVSAEVQILAVAFVLQNEESENETSESMGDPQ